MSELKTAKRIPIVRILASMRKFAKNPIPFMDTYIREKEGICEISLGNNRMYLTDRPEVARHILQKNHKNYMKSKIVTDFTPYIGHGLLTVDGAYWRKQRRLLQPGFHKQKLQQLTEIMLTETDEFMSHLQVSVGSGKKILLAKEMMELTMNVVARGLFGAAMSKEDLQVIDESLTAIQKHLVTLVRKPMVKPLLHLIGRERKIRKYIEQIDEIIFRLIRERRASKEEHGDLLDMLLNSRYEDTGEGMTDKQIRDESLIFFVAGHETSANALTWAFYLLQQHPEIEARILSEANSLTADGPLDFDKINQLRYTKQVIQEAMRLYPPAWILDRVALEDDQADGYAIPKGVPVNVFIYGIHRHEDYWPDPNKFDPNRFDPEAIKTQTKFSYFPFGGGPRLCIGQGFAMLEMQIIVAEMLQRFKLSYQESEAPGLLPLVTLRPENDMPMLIERR